MGTAVFETNFPGLTLKARGKVRDIYDLGDALLIVASDRISAFDVLMDSRIISVVSSPVDVSVQADGPEMRRRYKLEIRPPLGQSYAREIAARYGISYQQLEAVLSKRGVL